MEICYASMEEVNTSLEVNNSAHANAQVLSKLQAGSRNVESLLHRRWLAPAIRTVKMDWPTADNGAPWEVDLGENTIIEVHSVDSGGDSISASDIIPRRRDDVDEPPYTYLQILLSSNAAFHSGPTWQQALQITGLFGINDTDMSYVDGELGAGINSLVKSCVINPVAGSYTIGTGSIIQCGDEKMIVVRRTMSATTVTITSNLDDLQSDQVVPVSNGSLFAVDETILIDAERMRIVDIAGNNLIVLRTWDGSTLAEHTSGAAVYALRTAQVARGQLGTTAVSHNSGDDVTMHRFPTLINELAVAETVVLLEQASSAYARVVGSGNSARESAGKGLEDLRVQCRARYGRTQRSAAI